VDRTPLIRPLPLRAAIIAQGGNVIVAGVMPGRNVPVLLVNQAGAVSKTLADVAVVGFQVVASNIQ